MPAREAISAAAESEPAQLDGRLREFGGSISDDWNINLVAQVTRAVWEGNLNEPNREMQVRGTVAALTGIAPADELESMIAAQLIACHHAAMECYRRAMLSQQSVEGRQENLNQASKLSRTHAALMEALNRHRGKAQQTVRVDHVHVHAGGQAVVGVVGRGGGGGTARPEGQPHAKQLGHAPVTPMLGTVEAVREAVPRARRSRF